MSSRRRIGFAAPVAAPLAVMLALGAALPARADTRLEGGPWLPYRINRAKVAGDEPFKGLVELRGRLWDGSSRLLFRSEATARTRTMPIAFYADEEIRSLELAIDGREAARAASLDPLPPGEADRMRALVPPQRLAAGRNAPASLALEGAVAAQAGARIASRAFVPRMPVEALAVLAVSALAAAAAAALGRRDGRRSGASVALALAAALGGATGAALAATPAPTLYRAALPLEEPSTPLWGTIYRTETPFDGWRLVECRTENAQDGESGKRLVLLGIASGAGRGIPLEPLGEPDRPIRLSAAPLIVGREGSFLVESEYFLMGWAIHEGD